MFYVPNIYDTRLLLLVKHIHASHEQELRKALHI